MPRHGPGPTPVERTRDTPPDDAEWRADALAQSRHSRMDELIAEPTHDHDLDRATAVCAEITRRALEDFTPALVLLAPAERRRVQALAAFGLTLFDFARQSSLEGEKLAQMNRWSYDLEETLAGSPPGQPVFVLLAATHAESPWPEQALQDLVGCARRRALKRRATSVTEVEREARRLAAALVQALSPGLPEGIEATLAALLRVKRLVSLGDDQRRHQATLAQDEFPEEWQSASPATSLVEAVRRECSRLAPMLESAPGLADLPRRGWRPAARYAVLVGRRLARRCDENADTLLARPPRLGVTERLFLLFRSRWLRL